MLVIISRLSRDQQIIEILIGETKLPPVIIKDNIEELILDTLNTASSILGDNNPADSIIMLDDIIIINNIKNTNNRND